MEDKCEFEIGNILQGITLHANDENVSSVRNILKTAISKGNDNVSDADITSLIDNLYILEESTKLALLNSWGIPELDIVRILCAYKDDNSSRNFHEKTSDEKNFWYRVPILNVFYDFFLDDADPNVDNVRNVLENVTLLSALVLTVAIAIPLSVTYEDYENFIDRFTNGVYSICNVDPYHMINTFHFHATNGTFYLACSLFVTISILFQMAQSEIDHKYASIWWKFTVFFIFIDFIFLFYGCTEVFTAYRYFMGMTIPMKQVEINGVCEGAGDPLWVFFLPQEISNPPGYATIFSIVLTNVSMALFFVSWSFFTYIKGTFNVDTSPIMLD